MQALTQPYRNVVVESSLSSGAFDSAECKFEEASTPFNGDTGFDDDTPVRTVLHSISRRMGRADEEAAAFAETLEKNWINSVGDFRRLPSELRSRLTLPLLLQVELERCISKIDRIESGRLQLSDISIEVPGLVGHTAEAMARQTVRTDISHVDAEKQPSASPDTGKRSRVPNGLRAPLGSAVVRPPLSALPAMAMPRYWSGQASSESKQVDVNRSAAVLRGFSAAAAPESARNETELHVRKKASLSCQCCG